MSVHSGTAIPVARRNLRAIEAPVDDEVGVGDDRGPALEGLVDMLSSVFLSIRLGGDVEEPREPRMAVATEAMTLREGKCG